MSTTAQLLAQRARGEVTLRHGANGVQVLREAGCLKLRIPAKSSSAILINTSGGLAGGDDISVALAAVSGALTVTSQAAERVYRSMGPPAVVGYEFEVASAATLHWLPQETILFEGSSLARHMRVNLSGTARFMAVEALVFGRAAMGERVQHLHLRDHWDIFHDGKLLHAERLALGPALPRSFATLNQATAMATLVLVSPDVEALAPKIRAAVGDFGAVSCWNGKLVARLLGEDSFLVRKSLVRVIAAASGGNDVPKSWSM